MILKNFKNIKVH